MSSNLEPDIVKRGFEWLSTQKIDSVKELSSTLSAHVFRRKLKIKAKDMDKMFLYRNNKGKIIDKLKYNTDTNNDNNKLARILSKHSF